MNRARRPRVVLFEPSGRGGVCHYTYELAEHLSRAGAEVRLITTEDYELAHLPRQFTLDTFFRRSWLTQLRQALAGASRPGSRPVREPAPGRGSRGGYPPVLRRLRLRWLHVRLLGRLLVLSPDVVHFQWPTNRAYDRRLVDRLRRLGIPSIYTAHDVEPHLGLSPKDRADLQGLYRAVARIVVHAQANKRELLALFDVDPSKVAVIPHGSFEFFGGFEPLSREAARDALGIPRDRKVILFFGLIKRYKGLEDLVAAFDRIRETEPAAFLLVVGNVFAADPEGHRFYSGLLERLRERNDALCVGAYVPVEDVGSYLAASDVVALPYKKTSHSGVLLAAYAAGRPVVATDTGGLAEVVEPGLTGFVVPPGDEEALAAALTSVLADPERARAMGRRARQLATTRYAWSTIARSTLELYESVRLRKMSAATGRPEGSADRDPDDAPLAGSFRSGDS